MSIPDGSSRPSPELVRCPECRAEVLLVYPFDEPCFLARRALEGGGPHGCGRKSKRANAERLARRLELGD